MVRNCVSCVYGMVYWSWWNRYCYAHAHSVKLSLPQKLVVVSSTTINDAIRYFRIFSLARLFFCSFVCSLGRVYLHSTERVHVCVCVYPCAYVSTLLRHCRVVIDPLCSYRIQLSPQNKELPHAIPIQAAMHCCFKYDKYLKSFEALCARDFNDVFKRFCMNFNKRKREREHCAVPPNWIISILNHSFIQGRNFNMWMHAQIENWNLQFKCNKIRLLHESRETRVYMQKSSSNWK